MDEQSTVTVNHKCCHCDHIFENGPTNKERKLSLNASIRKSRKPGKDLVSVKLKFVLQLFLKLNDSNVEVEGGNLVVCDKCHHLYSRFFHDYDEMVTTMSVNSEIRKILDSKHSTQISGTGDVGDAGQRMDQDVEISGPPVPWTTPMPIQQQKPKKKRGSVLPPLHMQLKKGIHTVKGRRAYHRFSWLRLRGEIKSLFKITFLKSSSTKEFLEPLDFQASLNSIWVKLTKELEEHAPTILRFLEAISGTSEYRDIKIDTDYDNVRCVSPPVGMAFCLLANSMNQTCTMVQKVIGLSLYKGGLKKESFQLLNHMKVSVAYSSVLPLWDVLREKYDEDKPVENRMETEGSLNSEQDTTSCQSTKRSRLSSEPTARKNLLQGSSS